MPGGAVPGETAADAGARRRGIAAAAPGRPVARGALLGLGAGVHQVVHQAVYALAARLTQQGDRSGGQIVHGDRVPARSASSMSWLT